MREGSTVDAATAPRILIADDDDVLRPLLATLCRRHGYLCEVAEDGADALAKLEESAYDVLVLDAMMPKVNGFEVLVRLDALQWKPAVIMISALPITVNLSSLPGGELVHAVMDKSYGVDSLIARIADVLTAAT